MSLDEFGGWPGILRPLAYATELTTEQTEAAMAEILRGDATPAQIAAFIVALRMKGESVAEMAGMVRAMLGAATPLDLGEHTATAIDIVGAGGAPARQRHALNVSTMASFVAAGAGARVCKHGNRRASSTSGAFDFLELLGIPVEVTPEVVARCVDEAGVGFRLRPHVPPGDALRRAGARRDRHPDRLQHPRPVGQPRPGAPLPHRHRRRGDGGEDGAGARRQRCRARLGRHRRRSDRRGVADGPDPGADPRGRRHRRPPRTRRPKWSACRA